MRAPLLVTLALCAACRDTQVTQSATPEPYRGPAAETPTNQLRVVASAVQTVVTSADSLVVRYQLRNDGPTLNVGDFPSAYSFRVSTPEGWEIQPRWNGWINGQGGYARFDLAPGAAGEEHLINLACTEPERITFAVEFPADTESCGGWKLPAAGDYYVVVQYVPVPPPDSRGVDHPAFLPSQADTVLIRYRPPSS